MCTHRTFSYRRTILKSATAVLLGAALSTSTLAADSAVEATGKAFLGVGVNVFQYSYPVPSSLERIIKPGIGQDIPQRRTDTKEAYGSNFSEFAENVARSVGLEGSYGGFSASLNIEKTKESSNSQLTKFLQITNITSMTILTLSQNPAVLMTQLTDDFKGAMVSMPPLELFRIYGTHVMREVVLGGEVGMTFDSSDTKTATKDTFTAAARASYQGLGGSAAATANSSSVRTAATSVQLGQSALRVRGGSDEARQVLLSQPNPDTWRAWAASIQGNPEMLAPRQGSFMPVWELTSDPRRKSELRAAFLKQVALSPRVVIFESVGAMSSRPDAQVTIPAGYKLLSGGARMGPASGGGNLLTASYPENEQTWRVVAKDHQRASQADITAYALALHDPENIWEVKLFHAQGARAGHATASVAVPPGWVMVGGGARVNWGGQGNLLTGSYPSQMGAWTATSKDHAHGDPANIDVYAIGLRSRLPPGTVRYDIQLVSSTSPNLAHPAARATSGRWLMVGGGAKVNWSGAGNLLVSSYPLTQGTWQANSKDHEVSSPATITTWALGLQVQ